jgi:uncharacterized protein (DUF362 family)
MAMMARVSIVRGPEGPSSEEIKALVRRAVGLLGGMGRFVGPGQRVALKPNIVTGRFSGPGVTTDPRVLEALVEMAYEAGAGEVLIVEGAGYGSPTPEAFRLSGIEEMAERVGAGIVDVDEDQLVELEVPNPLVLDRIKVSKSFYEADVKVNVPVMKTHDQMLMTLGMKNMKGVIPKPWKRLFHRVGLARAIVDLNKAVPVDLTVVDAIHAMEGLGPSLGDVFEMDLIVAGDDVYALDWVGARIMGLSPGEVEYLRLASEQGLLGLEGEGITVLGESISSVARSFKRPPMELAPQEGVTVIEGGACSACRGTIRSVFYDLDRMGLLHKVRDLLILVGPKAELPEGPCRTPLIMGTCLKRLEGKGRYVIGCPPNNDKMIEAIRELCSI